MWIKLLFMHAILSSLIYITYLIGLHGWMLLDCLDSNKASTIPDLIYLASAAALGQACQDSYSCCVDFVTPWPFRPKGYCCRLCLSVCPSICLLVCKLYLTGTITHHRFELESPNLHQTCIMGWSWLVLKIGVIDLDLQGHFGHFVSEF